MNWKKRIQELKSEIYALFLANKDPRTPWYAKIFSACVVGYLLSPIDLIPDPIPIIGYLDDLIIVPIGIFLSLKMIPKEVMDDSRIKAKNITREGMPVNYFAAAIIVALWIAVAAGIIFFFLKMFK
jgi:uncharacterized membrane protein YkvA (DUF1232 family)